VSAHEKINLSKTRYKTSITISEIMKQFLDKDFLLQTETAKRLYHEHAAQQPIIDYHCHLIPEMVANDHQFKSLTEIWLGGDHYKWRAMRTNGIDERYITGKETSEYEKFEKWAETVPFTMRNPLYHWTHLELKTGFGIEKLLSPATAREIFDACNAKLATPEYTARGLMRKYKVEVVCTTDDPVDSLEHHIKTRQDGFEIKMLPTWRPDKAMAVEVPTAFRGYMEQLAMVSGVTISTFDDMIQALQVRHDFFAAQGCKLSDHGIEEFYAEEYTETEIKAIFNKVYGGSLLTQEEILKFKSAMLVIFAEMDCEKGWTQQFHYGAIRNNNSRYFQSIGPDTGFDSIGTFNTAKAMSKFLNRLDTNNKLAKTILYNLNPTDNEMIATMIGNFQDGTVPGKIQFGSGWWFLDQKDGMEKQMNALSVLGLLSRFVGMLTDSRSFLSYPRHEYFRRTLCNLIGNDVEQGLLPASEIDFIGQLVENISYKNAKNFFQF
jgi:glucuronate isomerase